MKQIEIGPFTNIGEAVYEHMPEGDSILYEFEIVPKDHRVYDRTTPKLYVTEKYVYLAYDKYLEIYDISTLEFDIYGDPPKFTAWQLWFEGHFTYSDRELESFRTFKAADFYPRLAFNEPNRVPKEFALRNGPMIARGYQTWAMAQLIINVKHKLSKDDRLEEMMTGYFTQFNRSTVITFFLVFIAYAVLKQIASTLPDGVGIGLDVLFGFVSAFMLWWTYMSVNKNLVRYEGVYAGYRSEHTDKANIPPNPVEVA